MAWQETGENVTTVKIEEPDLESHFERNWDGDDQQYRKQIEEWRGEGELTNLTRFNLGETGTHAYIADTSDLIIGQRDDEFMFYEVGMCWGVVLDFDTKGGVEMRMAYHMPGNIPDKEISLDELVKATQVVGDVKRVSVFYNQSLYKPKIIQNIEARMSKIVPIKFFDMDSFGVGGGPDIIIRGELAKQYTVVGYFNKETDESHEDRVHVGDWTV